MSLTKIYHPAVPIPTLEGMADVLRSALRSLHLRAITVSSGDLGIRVTVQQRGASPKELHVTRYTFDWPCRQKEADDAIRQVSRPSERLPEVGELPREEEQSEFGWNQLPPEEPEGPTPD